MERDLKTILLATLALAIFGCANEAGTSGAGGDGGSGGAGGDPGFGGEGGSPGSGGAAGAPGTPALTALEAMPRYAVVSSDFSSSSIALLDAGFEVIDHSWLSSGTTYPGLVATLSGDAVLPTRQAGDETFAVVDRFLTDVVTRFFLPSGNLNGQVRTQGESGDSGFSSNPQDLIFAGTDSAWIPRYETNLNPTAPEDSRGNDLFEIDPTSMTATGTRIDLSVLDTTAAVPGTEDEVEVFARPSRGLLFGTRIAVGLDRISAGFDAAGPGMVAIVDLEDQSAIGLELEGLQSCGRLVPVPDEPAKAAVGCVGFSNPFNDEAQLRASSGIAVIDLSGEDAVVERIWRVADDSESPRAASAVVALDENRVLAVASGNFVDTTDTLYLVELETGALQPVHVSDGSFTIGVSAWDADSEMLFVPDAAANAVIELAWDGSELVEVGSIEIAPGLPLPPTQVYLLN